MRPTFRSRVLAGVLTAAAVLAPATPALAAHSSPVGSGTVSAAGPDVASAAGSDGVSVAGSDGASVAGSDGASVAGSDGASVAGSDVGSEGASAVASDGASVSGAALRIMPLGDSITFGKGDPTENGYRADLRSWLPQPVEFVGSQRNGGTAHEGHPGWRIAQLTERIDGWMAESRPDVVLLDIGTNDLLRHDRVAEAPDRLLTLVDHIVAANPEVRILLAGLLVVDRGHEESFLQYNDALPLVAALHPENVSLVDMAKVPVANTVDHVHPNELGYRQMAYQWYEALRGVLPQGRAWSPVADPFTPPAQA